MDRCTPLLLDPEFALGHSSTQGLYSPGSDRMDWWQVTLNWMNSLPDDLGL